MSETASGFVRALAALREQGVDFVLAGVGGINCYARTPAAAFATLDLDAFLAPEIEKLLQSKQASGRPEDLAFLEAFRTGALDDDS